MEFYHVRRMLEYGLVLISLPLVLLLCGWAQPVYLNEAIKHQAKLSLHVTYFLSLVVVPAQFVRNFKCLVGVLVNYADCNLSAVGLGYWGWLLVGIIHFLKTL